MLILIVVMLPSFVFANISKDMQKTASYLSELLALSVKPDQFKSNQKEVTQKLQALSLSLKNNQAHFKGKNPHLEMNQKILTRLAGQALNSYKLQRYEVSRQLIQAQPNVCLSCHQNDKVKSEAFSKNIPKDIPIIEKAHLAQATRQPDIAFTFFEEALKDKSLSVDEIERTLRKKMSLSISERNMSEVKKILNDDLISFSKKDSLRKLIQSWLKGLDKAEKYLSVDLKNIKDVSTILKKVYGSDEPTLGLLANPEDEIFFLTLKKQILQVMGELKYTELPEAYYWMAMSERAVGYDLYYSLADSYLVTCIENWPKSAMAKKCFKEYESFIEFAYSGSSGTNIPQDVELELRGLEKKIKP